jgi:hypothetical protein
MSDVGNVDVIMWLCASPQTANELSLDLLELPDQYDRTFVSSALRDPTADDLWPRYRCQNSACASSSGVGLVETTLRRSRCDTMSPCAKWNLPLEAREWPSLCGLLRRN